MSFKLRFNSELPRNVCRKEVMNTEASTTIENFIDPLPTRFLALPPILSLLELVNRFKC